MTTTRPRPAMTHAEELEQQAEQLGRLLGEPLTIEERDRAHSARWRVIAADTDPDRDGYGWLPLGATWFKRPALSAALRCALAAAGHVDARGRQLASAADDTLALLTAGEDDVAYAFLARALLDYVESPPPPIVTEPAGLSLVQR